MPMAEIPGNPICEHLPYIFWSSAGVEISESLAILQWSAWEMESTWKVHHGRCLYPDDGLEILQGRLGLSEPQGAEKVVDAKGMNNGG
jgi:hypothetical protein